MQSKAHMRSGGRVSRPKRTEHLRFDDASLWHETGGALDEKTSETQWFEQSVGGTGRVQSPKKRGRNSRRTLPSKVKLEPGPGPVAAGGALDGVTGHGTGSGLTEVLVDGTEEIGSCEETMAAGWSQRELSLPQDDGGAEEGIEAVRSASIGRRTLRTGVEAVDLPTARKMGSRETVWAIEHPMASVMASTDEVDQRAGIGPVCEGGTPDEFWDLLQRQHRVAAWVTGAGCWSCWASLTS
ncbi:hypothetical protein JB92DRAFT_3102057 [Gautieria morchelliformis]|nr:hypothetical protein JB92DRAFT_3102057 [Gautieria morchelliformis]